MAKPNIEQPRWDQDTYEGRARHFFAVTNPLNLLTSSSQLETARDIVTKYRKGANLKSLDISEDELWKAKYLYDSAYHPDTGEKMIWFGRMSAQVPMNMLITGAMMTFYKSTPSVIFWQWFNQSFNAVVNYTNRSGSKPIPLETLGISYVAATSGAVATAIYLNKLASRAPPLVGRFVPLAAVAAANCVNIPLMRNTELVNGIELQNEKGEEVGHSKSCARSAISSVVVSRILMASPSMVLSPFLIYELERRCILRCGSKMYLPVQVAFCGLCLTFATPLCCALFQQRIPVDVDKLDDEAREEVMKRSPKSKTVYYNKGL